MLISAPFVFRFCLLPAITDPLQEVLSALVALDLAGFVKPAEKLLLGGLAVRGLLGLGGGLGGGLVGLGHVCLRLSANDQGEEAIGGAGDEDDLEHFVYSVCLPFR
jgi:hypothetical protein